MKTKTLLLSVLMTLPVGSAWADVTINETNFPDANFRSYLLSQSYGADGVITDAEIANVKSIYVFGMDIESLKGIEFFTALTELDCYFNKLTSLDVTKNTALTRLVCYNNQLTSLDVSKNTELFRLGCNNNKLTALDLSKNTKLEILHIHSNQINATAMDALVASLPTQSGTAMNSGALRVIYNEGEQNVMTTTQVAAAKAKNWTPLEYDSGLGWVDYAGSEPVSTGIAIDETNFPDANFRSYLLGEDYGADGVITDAEIANVKSIYVFGMDIESLKGIEFFTALTELDCYFNKLTSLDVTKNTSLTYLSCHSNQLTSLDVSKNTALILLHCYSNQITSLDVSKNTALISLTCYSNQLTSLDMSNNTSLTYLNCTSNQLTSLDVSKNTALIGLYCYSNQLTSLDVSNNTALTSLGCYNNQLTSLDVSKNTKLTDLPCYRNQIKDTAMDAFIASLPTASSGHSFSVIYNEGEQNVMTTTQVAAAKAKNWIPFAYDGTTWVEYAGSTPSAVNNVKASGNNAPAAAVKSFKDGTFVIEDGINQFNAAGAQMR